MPDEPIKTGDRVRLPAYLGGGEAWVRATDCSLLGRRMHAVCVMRDGREHVAMVEADGLRLTALPAWRSWDDDGRVG